MLGGSCIRRRSKVTAGLCEIPTSLSVAAKAGMLAYTREPNSEENIYLLPLPVPDGREATLPHCSYLRRSRITRRIFAGWHEDRAGLETIRTPGDLGLHRKRCGLLAGNVHARVRSRQPEVVARWTSRSRSTSTRAGITRFTP